MLDDLLEMFERDNKKNPNGQKQGGIRGLMNRLRGEDADERGSYQEPRDRRSDHDDDDDDDRYADSRGKRKRERDGFDMFDD